MPVFESKADVSLVVCVGSGVTLPDSLCSSPPCAWPYVLDGAAVNFTLNMLANFTSDSADIATSIVFRWLNQEWSTSSVAPNGVIYGSVGTNVAPDVILGNAGMTHVNDSMSYAMPLCLVHDVQALVLVL